jgi:hypothetical protein
MTMNWMIDGLYGNDYRTAMGYRALTPHAHDEWEIDRQTAAKAGLLLRTLVVIKKTWANGRASLQTAGIYASANERTIS